MTRSEQVTPQPSLAAKIPSPAPSAPAVAPALDPKEVARALKTYRRNRRMTKLRMKKLRAARKAKREAALSTPVPSDSPTQED